MFLIEPINLSHLDNELSAESATQEGWRKVWLKYDNYENSQNMYDPSLDYKHTLQRKEYAHNNFKVDIIPVPGQKSNNFKDF